MPPPLKFETFYSFNNNVHNICCEMRQDEEILQLCILGLLLSFANTAARIAAEKSGEIFIVNKCNLRA